MESKKLKKVINENFVIIYKAMNEGSLFPDILKARDYSIRCGNDYELYYGNDECVDCGDKDGCEIMQGLANKYRVLMNTIVGCLNNIQEAIDDKGN